MFEDYSNASIDIINEDVAQNIKGIISKKFSLDLTFFDSFVFRRRLTIALSFLRILPENIVSKTQKFNTETIDILMSFLHPCETELFRDTDTWIFLRDKILQKVISSNNANILIYNATSGEDLYSILMLINEYFPLINTEITVTSPSQYSLKNISEGIFAQHKNRSFLLNYKAIFGNKDASKYMEINNNNLLFKKNFLNNVIYKIHVPGKNTDTDFKQFDLVICRNKMLPFTIEKSEVFFEEIITFLKPKGYLVIGTNENLPPKNESAFQVISFNKKIFLKKTDDK
ncbi:MAG: hypothetical protein COX07_04745 [Bacteroidetes bacterium CG23_combo_of_CG06-09_8_20_14_all_32_9]|nr:MAG: hypothetical protein COX07_04745 [Bacteroidetes bacterium CG23_combo_of_CG06-09_8_20_14_all_32_9]